MIVPVMMVCLVLTKIHYCSDVIMGVITARCIEYELPLRKKAREPEGKELVPVAPVEISPQTIELDENSST